MSQHGFPGTADERPLAQDRDSDALAPATPPTMEHLQLIATNSRRNHPWMLVEVDGSPAGHRALVWALREAARREATVVAVSVPEAPDGDPLDGTARLPLRTQSAFRDRLEASVMRAVAETGISGRTRTAILERAVFDALHAAMHGADLVVVDAVGKRLLRPAVPRHPLGRVARGA